MAAAPPGQPAGAPPGPPVARRIPSERTHHGDTVIDEYAWLADKDDPETIALPGGRERLHRGDDRGPGRAARGHLRRDQGPHPGDRPVGAGPQGRLVVLRPDGRGQAVPGPLPACRPAREDAGPPGTEDGAPLPGEEILLDGNEVAGDSPFFSLGAFNVSPDGRLLAYSTDFAGDERFTLRIKDLVTGADHAGRDPRHVLRLRLVRGRIGAVLHHRGRRLAALPGVAAPGGHAGRRRRGGIEEADERFCVGVGLTRSERYVIIGISSTLTSEIWLLDAATPAASPRVVAAAAAGRRVLVEHQAGPDGDRPAADPAQRRGAELRAGQVPLRRRGAAGRSPARRT